MVVGSLYTRTRSLCFCGRVACGGSLGHLKEQRSWPSRLPCCRPCPRLARLAVRSLGVLSCAVADAPPDPRVPAPASVPAALCDQLESRLRGCVRRAVWQPGVLESWSGVLGAQTVAESVLNCFSDLGLSFPNLRPSLPSVPSFANLVDTQMGGRPGQSQGPVGRSVRQST